MNMQLAMLMNTYELLRDYHSHAAAQQNAHLDDVHDGGYCQMIDVVTGVMSHDCF